MVDYSANDDLTLVLKAVSDTTRRSLLTMLYQQGPSRVTDLAACYAMSLNAVSKHIKVLEHAGLVRRTTLGRVHLIEANPARIDSIADWLDSLRSVWALRLEHLDELLNEGENHDRSDG